MSTKRHAIAGRRQAQSRRTPGNNVSQGITIRRTLNAPDKQKSYQPIFKPLLPPLPEWRGPATTVTVPRHVSAVEREAEEIAASAFASDDDVGAAPGMDAYDDAIQANSLAAAFGARLRTDLDLRATYESTTERLGSAAERIGSAAERIGSAAERLGSAVTPFVTGIRTRAPEWRTYFQRSELNWRQGRWYREVRHLPRVMFAVIFIAIASTFALVVATKAAALTPSSLISAQPTPPLSGGIVLQQSPTPETSGSATDYLVGVWTSNASPATSGSLQVFVRLTQASQPVVGVPVSISVDLPGQPRGYGPVNTDGYGLATFTITYSGAQDAQPVYITGTAVVNGQKLTEQTYFVPQSGGGASYTIVER